MTSPLPEYGPGPWPIARELEDVRNAAVEQHGRVSRVLLKTPEIRVVVVGMAEGTTWPKHNASGRVLLSVSQGSVEVRTTNGVSVLTAGMLAVVEPGEVHDVYAREHSAFVLFVAVRA